MHARAQADQFLGTALNALSSGTACNAVLDQLPVPIYTVDVDGAVTYWNRACIDFAGRTPELGRDRWCVCSQLHTATGEPMARDACPVAVAVREQRAIRDTIAIAERPDGSRRAFRPYTTPLFDEDGVLNGAVNMLIDVTEEQTEVLVDQASRCRRLAGATYDRGTAKVLDDMAGAFERTVGALRQA